MVLHFDKTHYEFSSLAWLCFNAGDCEKDRENLYRIIKVEDVDGIIHCVFTDSHRMAIVRYKENCPLELGYYKIIKKSKSELILEKVEIDSYPNWRSVIPTEGLKEIRKPDENGSDFHFIKDGIYASLQTDMFFIFLNKCCMNYTWLEYIGAFFEIAWEIYHNECLALFHGQKDKEHDYFKFTLLAMKIAISGLEYYNND
jgi:hypothetical protein